jgi:hypothetical protein
MTKHSPLLAIGLASFIASSPASAQEDSGVVAPSTHAGFAAFGIGPGVGLSACGDGGCAGASDFTQVLLTQEIGFHPGGGGDGFALGLAVSEGFGNHVFRFRPGFKMWWDIAPKRDLGLYIAPTVQLGYALFSADAGPFGSADEHAFHAAPGLELRLVLADRALITFKPLSFDFYASDDGLLVEYGLSAGGGVTF